MDYWCRLNNGCGFIMRNVQTSCVKCVKICCVMAWDCCRHGRSVQIFESGPDFWVHEIIHENSRPPPNHGYWRLLPPAAEKSNLRRTSRWVQLPSLFFPTHIPNGWNEILMNEWASEQNCVNKIRTCCFAKGVGWVPPYNLFIRHSCPYIEKQIKLRL